MNTEILQNVDWGKPSLDILRKSRQLDFDYPSVMVIRHSERYEPIKLDKIHKAQLTEVGKKCAKNFGELLPTELKYRISHSISERTQDTAIEINQGIIERGGQSIIEGPNPVLSHILQYENSFNEYLEQDMGNFFNHWISGLYPPYKLEDSKLFAKRFGNYAFKDLLEVCNNRMNIYVSHDIFILNYMFHWFGINLASEGLRYLDGFIMQEIEGELFIYYKNGIKKTKRPFWVNKIG